MDEQTLITTNITLSIPDGAVSQFRQEYLGSSGAAPGATAAGAAFSGD